MKNPDLISPRMARVAALAVSVASLALFTGCASDPSAGESKQAAASSEHCYVTGSNLRQRECRNLDVRTLSREDAERIQSQSMVIPPPRN